MLEKELSPNVPHDTARQTASSMQVRCFCPVGNVKAPKGMGYLRSLLHPKKLSFFGSKNVARKLFRFGS